jgi:hypothetical protein
MCQKCPAPAADSPASAEWRACDALWLRLPSPELVTSAASLFEQAQPWAAGNARRGTEPESGRFRLTVGPGVVRLAWTNPVRREKAAQRSVKHHKADIDDWQIRVKDLRARHLLAGTAVDVLNGLRPCDPKRLAIYFTSTHRQTPWETKNTNTSFPSRGVI